MSRHGMLVVVLPLALLCAGCPKPPSDEVPADDPAPAASADDSDSESEGDAEPEPLLEPFDPPPLEELDAQVTWEEQPVLDAFELMREAKQPPLVSVDEALAMKNNSPEANEQILSALGQYPASDSDVDYEARFDRRIRFDLKSTNPLMQSSTVEGEYERLTGVNLIDIDDTLQPFGAADFITSWHVSSDRLFDKIVLRDDLTWTDGKPVTAYDVEFSFQTIMNPKVPVPAVRSSTEQLKWVAAYDDRTIVFFHKESLATNVWSLNMPVIPKHVYETSLADDYTLQDSDYHVKHERQPVCAGPYRLKSRVVGQEVVLERRDDWHTRNGRQVRRKPYFKEVRFRVIEDPNTAILAIKNGDVDDCEMDPEKWVTQSNGEDFYALNTKISGVEWSYAYIGWNCSIPLFEDKRVRRAMSYAFNHREMLDEICYGLYSPGTGTFHPTAWMAPNPAPEPYHQDLDKAEELLDAAGWDDSDGDGIRDNMIDGTKINFDFTLMIGEGSKTAERAAILMAENLDQIGIRCRPQPMEFTVIQQKARDHDFQAMMAGWSAGADPDMSANLWTTNAIDSGRNYCAYSNPEVDELFEQGKREFDRDKRAEIYSKIHMILWEDQPYTWVYFRNGFFGINKQMRGYAFSPRGLYGYGPGFDSIWMGAE